MDKSIENERELLKKALWKKAVGYKLQETVDEMAVEGGVLVPVKQRIVYKDVSPDLSAIKMLLDQTKDELDLMSDEELEKERERLIEQLKGL